MCGLAYHLNISRKVCAAENEDVIDLDAVNSELGSLEQKIDSATKRHNEFLKELDLPLLP